MNPKWLLMKEQTMGKKKNMNYYIKGRIIKWGEGGQRLKIVWNEKKRNCFNEAIMKTGKQRLLTSSICNQEEAGIYTEFSLRLPSLLKVLAS